MELKDRLINKINRRVKYHETRNLVIKEEVDTRRGFHNLEKLTKLIAEYKSNIAVIDVYKDTLSDIEIFTNEELK